MKYYWEIIADNLGKPVGVGAASLELNERTFSALLSGISFQYLSPSSGKTSSRYVE
jgi:hypothetical protein